MMSQQSPHDLPPLTVRENTIKLCALHKEPMSNVDRYLRALALAVVYVGDVLAAKTDKINLHTTVASVDQAVDQAKRFRELYDQNVEQSE